MMNDQLQGDDTMHTAASAGTELEPSLLERCRDSDTDAFAELYARYFIFARSVAASNTTVHDPGDVASEAFTRIWSAIQAGNGPTTNFKAYLAMAVRNVCYSWNRRSREICVEDSALTSMTPHLPDEPAETVAKASDCRMMATVFASLPQRWQTALLTVEVHGQSVTHLAETLGISPNAASALCSRARAGLRATWDKAVQANNAWA